MLNAPTVLRSGAELVWYARGGDTSKRSIAATVATMLHHSAGRNPHPSLVDAATQVGSQFSTTAVDPSAPRVVGSLPPVEEFTVPVYDQVHQDQFAAGEMMEFSDGNPCCSGTGDRSRNS